jgi:hypothetical protein
MEPPGLMMSDSSKEQHSLAACSSVKTKTFLILTHQWLQAGRDFAGLIYAHQLSVTIGQAVRDLELIAKTLDPQDMRNHIEFIPL